jgi:GxxExxY protein
MNSQESEKRGKELELKAITQRVIGAAISVHRELGPGFIESVYEEALNLEFAAQGIAFSRQKTVPVTYREAFVGEHRLDFLVEDCLVVELKAVKALDEVHFAVVRSSLKASRLNYGLLLNFSSMPLTIRRVLRERPSKGGAIVPVTFS